jgi:hypothetical protein
MTYPFFRRSVARPNSTKPNGGSNQRLCCVDLSLTALQRLRKYVMDLGFSTPEHRHYLEVAPCNLDLGG